ncbi:hypothetical protein K435DRAFT_561813, partial [Dendrothele bispora CBS 962.96]
ASTNNESFPSSEVSSGALEGCNDLQSCRTVESIFYNCIAVIFACTYVAIHPNIPRSFRRSSSHELIEVGDPFTVNWVAVIVRDVSCMCFAFLSPELVMLWAMRQWFAARYIARKYSRYGWTRTHAQFLIMGGFALFKDGTYICTLQDSDSFSESDQDAVLTIAKNLQIEPRAIHDHFTHTSEATCLLEFLIQHEYIVITRNEISAKSMSDGLTKIIAIGQTSWFIAQCIARAFQGLTITELEIVTVAFALLNIVTYIVWWNKPRRVRHPAKI